MFLIMGNSKIDDQMFHLNFVKMCSTQSFILIFSIKRVLVTGVLFYIVTIGVSIPRVFQMWFHVYASNRLILNNLFYFILTIHIALGLVKTSYISSHKIYLFNTPYLYLLIMTFFTLEVALCDIYSQNLDLGGFIYSSGGVGKGVLNDVEIILILKLLSYQPL